MMILIRLAVIALLLWGAWKLTLYILSATSKTEPCPRCDGMGYWEGVREKVTCKECNGTGQILKVGQGRR